MLFLLVLFTIVVFNKIVLLQFKLPFLCSHLDLLRMFLYVIILYSRVLHGCYIIYYVAK